MLARKASASTIALERPIMAKMRANSRAGPSTGRVTDEIVIADSPQKRLSVEESVVAEDPSKPAEAKTRSLQAELKKLFGGRW
jgi:hypothetical protein